MCTCTGCIGVSLLTAAMNPLLRMWLDDHQREGAAHRLKVLDQLANNAYNAMRNLERQPSNVVNRWLAEHLEKAAKEANEMWRELYDSVDDDTRRLYRHL